MDRNRAPFFSVPPAQLIPSFSPETERVEAIAHAPSPVRIGDEVTVVLRERIDDYGAARAATSP